VLTENLRRLIGMHVLRQEDLAQEVGVSKQAIFNIVSGRSAPGSQTAIKLAGAFGIGLDDLFADDPRVCLRAAVEVLEEAPVRRFASDERIGRTDPQWVAKLKRSSAEQEARWKETRLSVGQSRDGGWPAPHASTQDDSELPIDPAAGSGSAARGQTKRT